MLRERLGRPKVGRRHAPVRERELHVQEYGDHVRGEHESDADGPGGQRAPDQELAVERPVARHEGKLNRAHTRRSTKLCCTLRAYVQPAQHVEIEPRKGHHGTVGVTLVGNQQLGRTIPRELTAVKGGSDVPGEGRRRREERKVLNVGVVHQHVGDEVMYVVRKLPPADAHAAAQACDERADEGVSREVAGDASMASIVGHEHDMVLHWHQTDSSAQGSVQIVARTYPEHTEEEARCHVRRASKPEAQECSLKCCIETQLKSQRADSIAIEVLYTCSTDWHGGLRV